MYTKKKLLQPFAAQVYEKTRSFGATTRSLTELKDWLLEKEITHVAMESTGVYWKPVMNILEPDVNQRNLCDLTRYRRKLVGQQSSEKDSMIRIFEDANLYGSRRKTSRTI
jgi:hypothetical protein